VANTTIRITTMAAISAAAASIWIIRLIRGGLLKYRGARRATNRGEESNKPRPVTCNATSMTQSAGCVCIVAHN
jgi:hypothetical protein